MDARAQHDGAGHDPWDQEWVANLVRQVWPAASRAAYAICGNIHDAEEAVSDGVAGFLAALKERRLGGERACRAYLMTSVRHAAIDLVNRRKRRAGLTELVSMPATPDEQVERWEEHAAVAEAFARLRPRFQRCLRLVDVHGGDMAAAGQAMEPALNAGAMRGLVHRARRSLMSGFVAEMAGGHLGPACKPVVAVLVGGRALTADQELHLSSCAVCLAAEAELASQGVRRFIVAPVAVLSFGRVEDMLGPGDAPMTSPGLGETGTPVGSAGVIAACGCAIVLAAGIVSAGLDLFAGRPGVRAADSATDWPPAASVPAVGDPLDSDPVSTSNPADDETTAGAVIGGVDTPGSGERQHTSERPLRRDEGDGMGSADPGQPEAPAVDAGPSAEPEHLVAIVVGPGDDPVEVVAPPVPGLSLPPLVAVGVATDDALVGLDLFPRKFPSEP